jgi:hypothetical protein
MSITWFSSPVTLVNLNGVYNTSGTGTASAYIPSTAKTLVLSVWRGRGWTSYRAGVSVRIMPAGYSYSNLLDRAKTQYTIGGNTPSVSGGTVPGIDMIAEDVYLPVVNGGGFFYAVESTDAAYLGFDVANKYCYVQLWGYE